MGRWGTARLGMGRQVCEGEGGEGYEAAFAFFFCALFFGRSADLSLPLANVQVLS